MRPKRALIFSNHANERTHLPAVREACARAGIALELMGRGTRTDQANPESLIGEYDLVFAKARCALEALAVGASVVLCDSTGPGRWLRQQTLRGCVLSISVSER